MKYALATLAVVLASTLVSAQTPAPSGGPLTRHYRDGETLTYHMTAVNEEWHYTADASSTVKKTASGSYTEDFRWTAMGSNGRPSRWRRPWSSFASPFRSIPTGRLPCPN